MKRQFLLTRLLLLFALIVGSGSSAWATDYVKVTSLSDLVSGDTYIIATRTAVATAYSSSSNNLSTTGSGFTESSGTISTTTASPMEFTLETAGNSKYALKMSTNKYLGYNSSTNFRNSADDSSDTKEQWTIEYNSNYSMYTIVNVSATNRHIGVGNNVFKPYTSMSSNAPVTLYKRQGASDTRTAVNISTFSAVKTTLVVGETTTTSVTNDQVGWSASYTYSSSNPSVATVSSTGVITAVSKGNANITVTPNVDPSDKTYKQGITKSVTIIVKNPSHQASIYLSGVKISDEPIEEGSAISFPTVPKSLGGKSFMGWKRDTPIDGTTDVAPTLVRLANMEDADVSYYAVYATVSGNNVTAQLTTDEITSNLTSTAIAYGTEKTYNDESDGIQWVASGYTDAASRHWVQMKKASDSYFKITAPANINEVKVTISNTSNSKGGINDISKHGAFDGTVCLESSAQSTPTGACGSSDDVEDNVLTIVPTTPAKEFYLQVTAGARVWGIDIKYANLTYNGYCTTITEPITITDAGYATLCSDKALDFSGTNITAYTATDGKTKVTLNEITSGKVPANTPVVLHNADADGTPVDVPVIASADAVGDNDLAVVTDEEGKVGVANMFVLSKPAGKKVGFYVWEVGSTLNKGKVYLQGKASYGSRSFLGFDDETTGIEAVDVNTESTNVAREYYNLNGQRVTTPTKGLYIVNGKKVIFNK